MKKDGVYLLPHYRHEFLEEILCMYCKGMAVEEISAYLNVSSNDVNEILDWFAPYLG